METKGLAPSHSCGRFRFKKLCASNHWGFHWLDLNSLFLFSFLSIEVHVYFCHTHSCFWLADLTEQETWSLGKQDRNSKPPARWWSRVTEICLRRKKFFIYVSWITVGDNPMMKSLKWWNHWNELFQIFRLSWAMACILDGLSKEPLAQCTRWIHKHDCFGLFLLTNNLIVSNRLMPHT